MSKGARRWRPALLLSFVTAGVLWGGWKWSDVLHYRRSMARIEEEIEAGLVSRALKDLVELSAWYPSSDEVAYLVGTCEKARGRPEAAADAWAKIPADSTFAFRALAGRVELKLDQGRLSEAEQIIVSTRQDPRFVGEDPNILLGPVYSREGRPKEAMLVIEALWRCHNESGDAASETAINQLWLHIQLQSNPATDETIRAILEQAGQVAPDDDRIWLWKANLAVRTRSFAEAARWLDLCQARRPEDAAVWHARLDCAMATNRAPAAREALKHLPAAESNSAEVAKLAAWFAAQRGDGEAERKSLEHLIATDPCDFAALDRLITLRSKNGPPDIAVALRRRKDEITQLQARYAKLFKRHQPRRDAAELGRLAERLGRRFEAKAFLTIALASARDTASIQRDLARFSQGTDTLTGSARTLYELLVPEFDNNAQKHST
jgi:enediyne biosynthesis protein E4